MQPRDLQAEKILADSKNNPAIPSGLPATCLKAMFESSRTYGLFTTYFDEELYSYAANYYKTHDFGRERPMYAIVGVTRAIEDVEISQRNRSPYQDMWRFLEQDFTIIDKKDQLKEQVDLRFRPYFTARVDIKLRTEGGDFQIISVSDDKAKIEKPDWLNKNGVGYVIQSYAGKLEIVAKSDVDGQLRLSLKGIDARNPEDKTKRIPFWIDYTKLAVNGKVIFDEITPAWHDKSYQYALNVKTNDKIKIQVEWLPHRSDA